MLATSSKTRGGITSVLNAYKQCDFWKKYQVRWIETHIDRGFFLKLYYVCLAFVQYIFCIHSYDIVQIHTGPIPSLKRKYLFYKIAKMLNKKIIMHIHVGTQIDSILNASICNVMLMNCDYIIVLSDYLKQKILNKTQINSDKIVVIPNPCRYVPNVKYTDSHKIILYAGRLEFNKGYDLLIKAFADIANKYPDWKICFAGSGEIEQAKKLSSQLNITKQVVFEGWVTGEVKDKIFREASMLCLASYQEGFPMSVIDAWSYGLPLISTPVGGLKHLLIDKENSLVFEPGNVKQLSAQLELMITDPTMRKKISEASLMFSKTDFSIERAETKLCDLYSKL